MFRWSIVTLTLTLGDKSNYCNFMDEEAEAWRVNLSKNVRLSSSIPTSKYTPCTWHGIQIWLPKRAGSPAFLEKVGREAVTSQAELSAQPAEEQWAQMPDAGYLDMCVPPRVPSVLLNISEENSHLQTAETFISHRLLHRKAPLSPSIS